MGRIISRLLRRGNGPARLRKTSAEQEGYLAERNPADLLAPAGDRTPAEPAIKGERPLVVFECPDRDASRAAVAQVVAHGLEQARAETEALVFGRKIELIDLAVG